MNRNKMKSLRRGGGLDFITMALMVLVLTAGIAAANPFDVNIMKASPNQNVASPGLLDLNQGESVTLSLLTFHFNAASIPGSYPTSANVICSIPGTCTPSDVVVTMNPPNPETIPADPTTLVDQLSVKWTGANDPDGTLYLLTVSVGPGTPNNEVGSASRTIKGHKEKTPCTKDCGGDNETWNVEWFHTQPDEYKEFYLPEGQNYLVTTGFVANESAIHVWDNQPGPIDIIKGSRLKYWHNYANPQDLYINELGSVETPALSINGGETETLTPIRDTQSTVRLYGTFGEGAGDLNAKDPANGLAPENPPYTDPISPFFPQAPQAPVKDFVTFNPAIMMHNGLNGELAWPQLVYLLPNGNTEQSPKEKVFKRMNYQKDWFKDDYNDKANGHWDVVIVDKNGNYVTTVALDDEKAIHAQLELGNMIKENNNDITKGDTYAPAIVQEFTYMTLSSNTMPILVQNGSHILVPMSNDPKISQYGINSFESVIGSGVKDAVKVESEKTLGMDIDGDGIKSAMDTDGKEVSGDEKIVLVLDNKNVKKNDQVQFFDNVVTVTDVYDSPASIGYKVCDNEGGIPACSPPQSLGVGQVAEYRRGQPNPNGPFYIKLVAVNTGTGHAIIEVGRLFGNTLANVGQNPLWNEKAFIVQGVFYNVVGIKARDDTFKYIVIRQKLPKEDIKLYGKHLKVWLPGPTNPLPELPPFNTEHHIVVDVVDTQSKPTSVQDKIGDIITAPALVITYKSEDIEKRFLGELKEILNETNFKELWNVEWFHTLPWQYTEFVLPKGQKFLITTAWTAPEAVTHIWDGNGSVDEKPLVKHGDRLKFWFDPSNARPLFVNNSLLRLYGTFGEGAGDLNAIDPATGLAPENPPYTDVNSPFFPQSPQSPRKDFVTFNPAIMDHNGANSVTGVKGEPAWPQLIFLKADGNTVEFPKEKVFKRMNYQKDWFKDDYNDKANGHWDVVIVDKNGNYVTTVALDDKNAIHAQLKLGNHIKEDNNDLTKGDTYARAVVSEFTYMTLDSVTMPTLVKSGSHILIPMAHDNSIKVGTFQYRGLNTFESVIGSGVKDAVKIESEDSLNMDIDGDNVKSKMDTDGVPVSGDEKIVLVLDNKDVKKNDKVQFFDNVVTVTDVYDSPASIGYNVCDNEGGIPSCSPPQSLGVGQVAEYRRGQPNAKGPFYIKLVAVNTGTGHAIIEVGRLFGNTLANIGANALWNEKAFIVDQVFYNVVGIKAENNMFKYVVFRQKVPEAPIKLYGKHLQVFNPLSTQVNILLPEMAPFDMDHAIMEDVLTYQVKPKNQQDKIGIKKLAPWLTIAYTSEGTEKRFKGELKEIYAELGLGTPTPPVPTGSCTLPNGKTVNLNGDGIVDIVDASKLMLKWGTNDSPADLNGDGIVDIVDASKLMLNWNKVCT